MRRVMKFIYNSFLIFILLFFVQSSFGAGDDSSEDKGSIFVVNDNSIGLTATYKEFFNAENTNTLIFLRKHYNQIPWQLWDIISTSSKALFVLNLPYLYGYTAGFIAGKVHSHHPDSHIPARLKSSVTVINTIGNIIALSALSMIAIEAYKDIFGDNQATIEKKMACDTHHERSGVMPVYPQNPWLGRHFYQKILFSRGQGPKLEINRLISHGGLSDNEALNDISEWSDLYDTLSWHQIDKLVIEPDENSLKLSFEYNAIPRNALLVIDSPDMNVTAWDIDIRKYCSTFSTDGVYSVFHKNTLKAITSAIRQAVSFNNSVAYLSLKKSNVTRSGAGAAVVRLDDDARSSWVVYSDRDFHIKTSGYFLIAEPEQKAQKLFDMALYMKPNSISKLKTSQTVWEPEEIDKWIALTTVTIILCLRDLAIEKLTTYIPTEYKIIKRF
ncbi:hypothetical protein NX722_12555 [Endozoicomonas gorgoniicola]|uniref:Uncharacterized protein n=1 Tax=Endozoicomonas gorgoniicola TaxID=1234144 RepID=A0ABT3MVN5_9GAMM|nr:hypothetical protein [Endozoicomonas gorgoniicola]MCW7553451.1 hypothetical protein [Endozoicomonas gorgoniicola]